MVILFLYILLFSLGLSIGSFLNVVIYRVNHEDSVTRGRSYCPRCKHTLSWLDLIPLLSFLLLGGKCRYCRKAISWQYPIVEAATGMIAVGLWVYGLRVTGYGLISSIYDLRFTNYELFGILTFVSLFIIFSSFLVIFVSDFLYQSVPTYAIISGLCGSIIYIFLTTPLLFLQNLLVGFVGFSFFMLLILITKGRGMGFGDALISFLMGFLLGIQNFILAFYISFLTGAFWGVILILIGKKRFGQKIAFGPFLIFGTVIAFFIGELIWQKIKVSGFLVLPW